MNKDLYLLIIDFVFTCKQLQYIIKKKFVPESNESLLREFGLKNIPRKGEVEFQGKLISYSIHGSGITYSALQTEFSHTFYLGKGLDIIFNLHEVLKFHQIDFDVKYIDELNQIEKKELIMKLFEHAQVYYLL